MAFQKMIVALLQMRMSTPVVTVADLTVRRLLIIQLDMDALS